MLLVHESSVSHSMHRSSCPSLPTRQEHCSSYIYPICCNDGLCTASPFRSKNGKPLIYMSLRPAQQPNKSVLHSYYYIYTGTTYVSIYISPPCMYVSHLPCSASSSNKLSQRPFRISYASEHGRPITLDPLSVGSSITSPNRTSVSMALSIGISIYKQIQTHPEFP